ncbi:MAG: transposase [Deltaproteobacteria bacterium]|nr:transposase [Deltaproteobacteria bacterium]
MSKKDFQIRLEKFQFIMPIITDPKAREWLTEALNLMEIVTAEREELKKENQQLKDEINRLKGEQGKPNIKGGKKNKPRDHSSEKERKNKEDSKNNNKGADKKNTRNRKPKLAQIKIDREQICTIDKSTLPADAVNKGYTTSVIQDIKIITDNVKYCRETYYSASTGKTYIACFPSDVVVKGEYGVGIRSLIPLFKSECNLSESRILGFFQNFGIIISPAYISNQWTTGYESFHQEKTDIYKAGLSSGSYHQIDDTSARVSGENYYTQIICNLLFSAYFTIQRKDRLSILDVFRNFAPRQFLYNTLAIQILKGFRLPKKLLSSIDKLFKEDELLDETSIDAKLKTINKLGPTQLTRIKEAFAIAAYREQTDFPIIEKLVCDDAPQFKLLTQYLVLCWIHDGRHYKKLNPIIHLHQTTLDKFITRYWVYYHKLLDYKEAPNQNKYNQLSKEFDDLFSTQTNYEQLNDRIAKTFAKKEELLLVLDFPELPLHNNESELAARVQARIRDVSLHTMSKKGTQIKDTFMTISQTAKKLGVRTYEYIYDRISGKNESPSLAQLIEQKAINSERLNFSLP